MHVLPMGERAVLVEDLGADPAAETVLVTCTDHIALERVQAMLAVVVPAGPGATGDPVELVVRYDGVDLADVAAATGLTVDAVIAAHAGATYEVAFCGFAPGFAYLRGLDAQLHLPRRATPRTSVPAGSVAIASGYSAVYPRASPGGWHLLGTTEAVLFDAARTQPALLTPGAQVRFVPT